MRALLLVLILGCEGIPAAARRLRGTVRARPRRRRIVQPGRERARGRREERGAGFAQPSEAGAGFDGGFDFDANIFGAIDAGLAP